MAIDKILRRIEEWWKLIVRGGHEERV